MNPAMFNLGAVVQRDRATRARPAVPSPVFRGIGPVMASMGGVGASPQRQLQMGGFGDELDAIALDVANAPINAATDVQFAQLMTAMSTVQEAAGRLQQAAQQAGLANDPNVQNFAQLSAAFTQSATAVSYEADPVQRANKLAALRQIASNLDALGQRVSAQLGAGWFSWGEFFSNLPTDLRKVIQSGLNVTGGIALSAVWQVLKPVLLIAGAALVILFFAGKIGLSGSAGPIKFNPTHGFGRYGARRNRRRARRTRRRH